MTSIRRQGRVFLVVGMSQKGKSSIIKDITGLDIKIGSYGKGISTTDKISGYVSEKHFKGDIFIDLIGLYGNDLTSK